LYTYHLKNILECNGYNNEAVIAKLKAWGCTYSKSKDKHLNGLIAGWQEKLIPPHAPANYPDLIQRLDDGFEYQYAGETFKPTSRVQRSGRIYTTMVSDKRKLCFQAQKSKDRALFTWKGEALASFDVSASQLRIAHALRGVVLPFGISPWDSLHVEHPVMDTLPPDMARELKKTVALLLVRGERKLSYKRIWCDKIEAPYEDMPPLKGYQEAVAVALLADYPDLRFVFEGIDQTPDGYAITHKSKSFARHDIQCRPLDIKTTFKRYASESPTEGNVLEAMEAYVLRQVIRSLPIDTPVLACHDQLYVLPDFKESIERAFESEIKQLANQQSLQIAVHGIANTSPVCSSGDGKAFFGAAFELLLKSLLRQSTCALHMAEPLLITRQI